MKKQYLTLGLGLLAVVIAATVVMRSGRSMDSAEPDPANVVEIDNRPTQIEQDSMDQEEAMDEESAMQEQTIVDIAVADGRFENLVTALQQAELVETLSGEGPFTVFAPTDEAFAKLPDGTLESLLQDKEQLTAVLTYHVVSGKVMASDVVEISSAQTLQGQEVSIDATDGVMINDAQVVLPDVEASNGVIHVIDTVLIPQ